MRIYYRQNAILLADNPVPFVAGTLTARLNAAAGTIEISRVDSAFILANPHWAEVSDADGNTFATPDAALGYLAAQFAMRRTISGLVTGTWVGARALSAPRAVRSLGDHTLDYASAADIGHRSAVLGVTASASDEGMPATVMLSGQLVSPGWGLTPGLPLFLGVNGLITQAPPRSPLAFSLRLGIATDPDTAIIRITQPITLS